MAGIVGYGVYVPRYRIKQQQSAFLWGNYAMGEKAFCGADEDVVTMAAEAAEKAMIHAGIDPGLIGAIHIGTASSPYIDQCITPILAETLELDAETSMVDYSGSINALGMAMLGCLDAIAAKRIEYGIVIGTDNRATAPGSMGEASFGASAVAMVIGNEGTIADIEDVYTYSTFMMDRWRSVKDEWVSDYFDDRFDREYGYQKHIVEASRGVLQKVQKQPHDMAHVVFPQPNDKFPTLPAKDLGIDKDKLAPLLASTVGDLGTCSAFVSLAGVFDKAKPGEQILLASYGSGASNAMSIVITDEIEKKRGKVFPLEKYLARKQEIDYPNYLRMTGTLQRAPY